jgi:hypothetical protein
MLSDPVVGPVTGPVPMSPVKLSLEQPGRATAAISNDAQM